MRGQIIGETAGFVKLVFSPEDQRLLGAAVVGEGACELIHVAGAVLGFHGTIDYFIQAVFTYPTLSEAFGTPRTTDCSAPSSASAARQDFRPSRVARPSHLRSVSGARTCRRTRTVGNEVVDANAHVGRRAAFAEQRGLEPQPLGERRRRHPRRSHGRSRHRSTG